MRSSIKQTPYRNGHHEEDSENYKLFAEAELKKGESITAAALNGARFRLRPILMISFAFIIGPLPLWAPTDRQGDCSEPSR
jgi:AcrB/AcrD/AcrF family